MEREHEIYRRPNAVAIEEGVTYKPKDFVNTLDLLERAFREGADKKKPAKLSEHQWLRRISMVETYYYETDATKEDVGLRNGITKERARQVIKKTILDLQHNTLPETQELFPIETLCFRKPLSQRSRDKKSESRGGVSLRIREQVEKGVIDIDEISKNTGISERNIRGRASSTLKDWGINVPRKLSSHKEALKQLEEETDDKKIQELLDQLPYHVITNDMYRKKGKSQFCRLKNLIREVGFHLKNRDTHLFATSLKTAGVPISRKDIAVEGANPNIHYILLSRYKDRAMKALRENQGPKKSKENPVKLLCGPGDAPLPATTLLVKRQGYKAVGRIFNELGMYSRRNIRYSDFFTSDCPVPVFCMGDSHYFYPVGQKEELKSFIAKKLNAGTNGDGHQKY